MMMNFPPKKLNQILLRNPFALSFVIPQLSYKTPLTKHYFKSHIFCSVRNVLVISERNVPVGRNDIYTYL